MPPSLPPVPRRRFGRTEIPMPVLSCGGMRYQQSWKEEEGLALSSESQATVAATVARAWEAGINHFETARGYGTSERQLGEALLSLPREQLIVQTKGGPKENPADFRRAFETSLERLGMDSVDLFAFHGVNNEQTLDWVVREGGCLEVARELQRAGRFRFLGFSTHGPVEDICRAIETDAFDYVNLHWYFVNPLTWPAVEAARRHDMGVFIISPNDKGGMLQQPSETMLKLCAPLEPMTWHDAWCLLHPEVHTLSIGAARPSDFDAHLAALPYLEQPELIREIEQRIRKALVDTLGAEWMAHWHEGLPRWQDVPGEINVREILRLWTFAKPLGLIPWAKMRYNLLGNAEHWFPGKNAADMDEAAMRRSLQNHPFADRIPEILREAHALFWEAPKKRLSESE